MLRSYIVRITRKMYICTLKVNVLNVQHAYSVLMGRYLMTFLHAVLDRKRQHWYACVYYSFSTI